MPVPTIEWHKGRVRMIDQRRLPEKLVYLYCKDAKSIWQAIRKLKIRGAPAIGIAGAFGVALQMQRSKVRNYEKFDNELRKVIDFLGTARPTAVNLFWALDRMKSVGGANQDKTISELKDILLKEALKILEEDKEVCRKLGQVGSPLIRDGDTILTHCNAGGLATADYGTALGVVYRAVEEGKKVKVYVDETRPYLQGARLTAWELMHEGIDATLICDGTAGKVISEGRISKVLVGADRIAANGDCANKVGTYVVAVLSNIHHIPFYVVSPISSFDLTLPDGNAIPIEERNADEVTTFHGKRIAPKGIKAYNPAFDVTPGELITAIITEKGIVKPPYERNLREQCRKAKVE